MELSALVVLVPEAEELVGDLRLLHDPPAADGMPAHVTLLFPFMPIADVNGEELAGVTAAEPAFEVAFRAVRRWPDVLYLAPEPSEPFRRLTEAFAARYPDWPPYGGAHDTVIPHLTVASTGTGAFDEIEAALRPGLPLRAQVGEAWLMTRDPGGRWQQERNFALGGRQTEP